MTILSELVQDCVKEQCLRGLCAPRRKKAPAEGHMPAQIKCPAKLTGPFAHKHTSDELFDCPGILIEESMDL